MGIRGLTLCWLISYLNDRRQCTIANGHASRYREIMYGVPQGSVLGPLLFLCYINDINTSVSDSIVKLYADDRVIYAAGRNIGEAHQTLSKDLFCIEHWCKNNQLTVNITKTKSMLFGTRRFLKREIDHYKYLGRMLDQNLTFKMHAQNVYKCASHKIYILWRIRP